MDSAKLSCCICLDILKTPVTIPCGHSYCMNCIKTYWDQEKRKGVFSCPQCRETFTPRPVLVKNIVLADLVEDLKKTGLQASPADHCYAGPEDVACDVCTGRKMKAVKSCLVCMASYCENHIQPHYASFAFRKHELVDVFSKPQQNIHSRHDEVRRILFNKFKTAVPAAAERTEKQKEMEAMKKRIHQRIVDRKMNVKVLQKKMDAVSLSADKAVEDTKASPSSSINKPIKNRPLSMETPPDPVPGVSSDMKKLQPKEDMIKNLKTDKLVQEIKSPPLKTCGKCGKALSSTQPALQALDKIFHSSCFSCVNCQRPLQGMQFYDKEGLPQCKRCYTKCLADCYRCGEKITGRILKAMGKCFHVHCFFCSTCSCTLEGVPFITGEDNKPYCVQDYHRRFSPVCEICKEPIVPGPGSQKIMKLVVFDKNFHIQCYRA
ncbi:PREDICTED: zyxin-like [Cyprinodon variegatus]|uniref:zyxin-like n=1 Tax=Cyprinodon variegatus TaxID=28743 RepID=UPI0007426C2D|nr:PREDICTED: zyxin-like [Cyprinodon variegatus]